MQKTELYQKVTDKIIEALEAGVDDKAWKAPWHASVAQDLPQNAVTHKAYRGINTWVLWAEQALKGYTSNQWATYKQWAGKDCQVRKGQKGTTVILWKPGTRTEEVDGVDREKKTLFTSSFTVFNADQVDGYEKPEAPVVKPFQVIERAQAFFDGLGAKVDHGGARAYYTPAADRIQLPLKEDFKSPEDYYAVSGHEHTHWTADLKRCDRDLSGRFGSDSYAAEELVAELGSAYLCGLLGISNEPREDHAQYLSSWIKILKADPSAIVTAASKAQQAVDWLVEHSKTEVKVAVSV